ncbi:MAG TPA: uracil-DNA glycosylase family protein [Candidatus Thermoplasmatota archaeon]|nr:uracil-DNA glycosylase family protein [Candidatus Thermoplasmatota archaeon]
MSVLAAAARLRDACDALDVPGAHVYNPLAYAWEPHARFAERYGATRKRAVLVGMNPGPWGMGQTGVPFGDVRWVRDWMGVEGRVEQPARAHPKRPVRGFACTRREGSGNRLYGWASERFGSAEAFFRDFYVVNYCPLLFFDADGKNLTPPQVGPRAMQAVDEACDRHLAEVLQALEPLFVVGVGQYAEERAKAVVARHGLAMKVGRVLHPSPASPAANRGWVAQAEAQLAELGVLEPGARVPA